MHLNEDDLILHYYGEAGDTAEDRRSEAGIDAHLASCTDCGAAWQQLRRVMETIDAAPAPEPGRGFERDVWARLAAEPELFPVEFSRLVNRGNSTGKSSGKSSGWRAWFSAPRLVLVGGLAAVVLVVGALRMTTDVAPAPETAAADAETHRERVMLAAVSEHIEQSQVVLVELANAETRDGGVDVTLERTAADDLVSSGRLYRETAIATGNMQLATLLEELEMVLVDIARGPEALSAEQLSAIRQQIETQELIFKLQVLGADVKARRDTPRPTSQRTL